MHDFLAGFRLVAGYQDVAIYLDVPLQQVGGHVVVCRGNPRPVAYCLAGDDRGAPLFRQLDYGYFRRHERHRGVYQDLSGQTRHDALQGSCMSGERNSQHHNFRPSCRRKVVGALN